MHNFAELEKICKDAVLIKRARHVIGEIERTRRAAESLKSQDFVKVSWEKFKILLKFCLKMLKSKDDKKKCLKVISY